MGKIDLQSDEVIVRETKGVTVRSIPLDAILTTRRLILVDSRIDAIPQKNIPLASIREIKKVGDAGKDPAIVLSVMTESGSIREMVITFPSFGDSGNNAEFKEWVQSLEDRTASTRAIPHVNTLTPVKPDADAKPGILPIAEPAAPPKARDWVPDFTPFIPKSQQEPTHSQKKAQYIKIGAIILAIVVIIGVILVVGQFTKGKTTSPQAPVTPLAPTTKATPFLTSTPTQTLQVSPIITVSPVSTALPQYLIPKTGVWVRLQYPGNYVGYIGAQGLYKQVNSTGEQYLQLPVATGMIDGSIEKQDGSTDNLIVEIYKDGALISQKSTRTPQGVLDIHVSV
jgi:hypothetical protein